MFDTDYIHYDYVQGCAILHGRSETKKIPSRSLRGFLDSCCIQAGSTLEGRLQACRRLCAQRCYLPVLICTDPLVLLLPTGPMTGEKTVMVSFSQILSLHRKEKNRCIITFRDGLKLEVSSPERMERIFRKARLYVSLLYSSQSSQ